MSPRRREAAWASNLRRYYRSQDFTAVGIVDGEVMLDNALKMVSRRKAALDAGFDLEVIALTSHELEWFLMLWIAQFETIGPRRKTLGGWIGMAERHGLVDELVTRLRAFNRARGRAIHRLLRGDIRYEDLRSQVIDEDPKLLLNVMTWVNQDILSRSHRSL